MGQIYGPFLQPDKFKTRGLAILDYFGTPVLYYAANPSKPSVTVNVTTGGAFGAGNSYVGTPPGVSPNVAPVAPTGSCQSLYNYADNDTVALNMGNSSTTDFIPAFSDITVMQVMLGDYNFNGYIDSGESAATTASFLLWSAGPDGQYGAFSAAVTADTVTVKKAVSACDDVTNFSFAQ
jgi:hypothetical protein